MKRCQTLDSSSTLISIHSRDEQQFIDDITAKYHNISTSVWIGLNYGKNSFIWQDQTETNYTNWSDEAAKDGEVKCVVMSLVKDYLGKWNDVPCKNNALTICQKKQDLTLISLRNSLVTLENTLIPLGFLYTQFPSQSSPDVLWPNMKWTEVTQSYAGLFFRAEGGNSSSYGQLQLASAPHLAQVIQDRNNGRNYSGNYNVSLEQGKETGKFWTGTDYHPSGYSYFTLSFKLSNEEVRPINKAIKIWKRTG